MESIKNYLNSFLLYIKKIWIDIWNDKKKIKPMYLLGGLLFILLAFIVLYSSLKGGYFHMSSDDTLQYYPYINNFFTKLKSGTLSLYDTTLFGGTSFFSGIYYIPLDIFTFVAFIFSYFIEAEKAYAITNFLRPACGALLIYYVLIRKGMSAKTAFISGLILFVGGTTEAYYIFPVFLGICFYAPLAMFVVDLVIEKKGKYYLLIPLYTAIVIFYDFYIAYMLMAFLCVYFVVENHVEDEFSFFGKNTIFKNGKFWLSFIKFFAFIILGVMMSAVILFPSMLYVMNESSRNNTFTDKSLWYFTTYNGDFSLRHYFTQWINFFIPNEPHRFCLNDAGDYMREHATMYITNGGLIFLVYLFTIKGKKENRMKFWIILMNILFCIPLFACIFSFNSVPYVRWFFIPYMINLYGMAMALDKNDLKVGDNPYLNLCPIIFLVLGLATIIFTIVVAPEYYIHYKREDFFFYPILIGSAICITIYLVLLIISFILKIKKKDTKIIRKIFLGAFFCEVIFAGVMIFCNVDDANSYYFEQKNEMTTQKNTLYNLGYKDSDGYRIHLDTDKGKDALNGNIWIGNVNFGHFFQSFYNTPLNKCLSDIYNENSTHWGRDFMGGNSLIQAPIFNTKYIVCHNDNNTPYFPSDYYTELLRDNTGAYYSLTDCPQFIVYDSYFSSTFGLSNALLKEASLLYSAYVYSPYVNSDGSLAEDNKDNQRYLASLKIVENNEIESISGYTLASIIKDKFTSTTLNNPTDGTNGTEGWEGLNYYYYNLANNPAAQKVLNRDVIYAYSNDVDTRRMTNDDYLMVLNDQDKTLKSFHFNEYFNNGDAIYAFAMKVKDTTISTNRSVTLYGYDYSLFDDFIERQNSYTNRYYSLDGSTMKIKCDVPSDKAHIIKTAYTYSEDWKLKNNDYELIDVDGGFLGIVIPKGVTNVDLVLKYEPSGFYLGLGLSIGGAGIYLCFTLPLIIKRIKKKKERLSDGKDSSDRTLF